MDEDDNLNNDDSDDINIELIEKQLTEAKLAKIKANNSWNDGIEETVRIIGENSKSYNYMHNKSVYYFSNRHKSLTIGITIIGIIAAVLTFVSKESFILGIVSNIFSSILGGLVTLMNFLNYSINAREHRDAEKVFMELFSEIITELSKYRKDRSFAPDFMVKVSCEYNTAKLASPEIPEYILKNYTKLTMNSTIAKPDLVELTGIKIVKENAPNSNKKFLTDVNDASVFIPSPDTRQKRPIINDDDVSDVDFDYTNEDDNISALKKKRNNLGNKERENFEMERFQRH